MNGQLRCNRLIDDRTRTLNHAKHIERLQNIKSMIRIKRPKTPTHVKLNLKKAYREQQTKNRVLQENHILLTKMLHLDKKRGPPPPTQPYVLTSLNRGNRIRSLSKIMTENKALVRKL